jgi:hypothetical protein
MPQACKICKHPERPDIDAVLAEGWPSLRAIGAQYSVTKDSLLRHWRAHLAPTIEEAPSVEDEWSEPRQNSEDPPVKNSERTETAGVEDTEARYPAFIERWRKRVAIKADEMATWPEGIEGSRELLQIACARGDLFALGDYYCATARQILRFRLSGSATCRL